MRTSQTSKAYVVEYDNSSGYFEWACKPQPTPEMAWRESTLSPGQMDARLTEIVYHEFICESCNTPYGDKDYCCPSCGA